MCKKKVAEVDESKNIEESNYGLLLISENNLGTMGIVEVVAVILLILAIIMTRQYCVRKKKQRRMRDLNSALKEGLSASASASYRPGSLPVVQFSSPGSRVVSMQEIAPSAPAQPSQPPPTPLGLWEQCR